MSEWLKLINFLWPRITEEILEKMARQFFLLCRRIRRHHLGTGLHLLRTSLMKMKRKSYLHRAMSFASVDSEIRNWILSGVLKGFIFTEAVSAKTASIANLILVVNHLPGSSTWRNLRPSCCLL